MKTLCLSVLLLFSYVELCQAQQINQIKLRSESSSSKISLEQVGKLSHTFKEASFSGYYMLLAQFEAIPDVATQAAMKAGGIKVLGYIPELTYQLAIPTNKSVTNLKRYAIKNLMVLPKQSRLAPSLKNLQEIPIHARSANGTFYVSVFYPTLFSEDKILADLKHIGACIHDQSESNGRLDLLVNAAQLEQLQAKPYVLDIAPIAAVPELLDYRNTSEYGSRLVHKIKGICGRGVTVAVGDNSMWDHVDGQNRVMNYNTNSNTHGNVVSGLIAGSGNVEEKYTGHAPAAFVITRSQVNFTDHTQNLYNNFGIALANHSYGAAPNACGEFGMYDPHSRVIDEQLLAFPKMMHVLAVGNSGDDCPDSYNSVLSGMQSSKNGLAVGNLSGSTTIAHNSSRGPTFDGRLKPEVCAKGVNTKSTALGNGYHYVGGTSSAAPIVVGVMALMIEQYKKIHGSDPKGDLMKVIACNTALDLGNPGPDYKFGFGRISSYRSVEAIQDENHFTGVVSNGQTNTHSMSIPAGTKQVKVMLYWNDVASAAAVGEGALVNDLDIRLTDANGTTYLPWVLDPHNVSENAVRGTDHVNNIEQITIDLPTAGLATITIEGGVVPVGGQDYVVSFDFIKEGIKVIHPSDGTAFLPRANHWINWGAYGDQNPFSLYYSVNNGFSWNLIADNIPGGDRGYYWLVPDIVSNSTLVKVVRAGQEAVGPTPFAIIESPNISLSIDCDEMVGLNWPAVKGATAYEVFRLGPLDTFMVSLGIVADTFYNNPEPQADQKPWYSVRAVAAGGIKGKRIRAIQVDPNPKIEELNFTYGIDSLMVDFINLESAYSNYMWDFGDGVTSTSSNPSHLYQVGGTYSVCLTAFDDICSDSTLCRDLVISGGDCRVRDSLQLVAILNNLSNYSPLDSLWDERPLEEWEGVVLTEDGCNVWALDLPNGMLTASTFPALNLPELTILNLSGNFMSGEVSGLELPKIEEIYLYDNFLSGSMPDLSESPNLRYLCLHNNNLEGEIPDLQNPLLKSVFLNDNNFTGPVPKLTNTSIRTLWLYNNQLSGRLPDYSSHQIVYLDVSNNALTFDGMEENIGNGVFKHDPQAQVPVFELGEALYLEVGGTEPYNEYSWYNDNGQLVSNKIGNKFFIPFAGGNYYCKVYNPFLDMELTSVMHSFQQKNKMDVKVWMEGCMAGTPVPSMTTELNRKRLLPGQRNTASPGSSTLTPAGQPYSSRFSSNWNYEGIEGLPYMEYDWSVVDWVLVSLYSDLSPTLVHRTAALLHHDGQLEFFRLPPRSLNGAYYIVIEHRNHMAVMSTEPVPVVNYEMTFDFRDKNSFVPVQGYGVGQKQLASGVWAMYAGEGLQTNPFSYDINGYDKLYWVNNNGSFTSYNNADYNLDGDVSGTDKNLMSQNNGIYSGVPKSME